MGSEPRGDLLGRALRAEAGRYLRAFAQARDARQGAIHELRIATRRLAALLQFAAATYADERWRDRERELRGPFRKCARLRDLQATRAHLRRRRQDEAVMERVLDDIGAAIRRHRMRVAAYLAAASPEKTCRRILRLAGRVSAPGHGALACTRLLARSRQAARAACRGVSVDDQDALHRARVAIKVYRYQLEVAASLGLRASRDELRALRQLQRDFGAITDLELLRRELKRYARRHPKAQRRIGPLRAGLEQERDRRIRQVLAAAALDAIVGSAAPTRGRTR